MNEVSMTQLYSILATLRDYDGILRTKLDGSNERPGWKYIMRFILCMSPFHFKGGIARSNLYYHGARNWIISTVESLYDPSTHPYSLTLLIVKHISHIMPNSTNSFTVNTSVMPE